MKKFPGKLDSLKLLYVKSNTSRTANAPKPRGNESKRFILQKKLLIVLSYHAFTFKFYCKQII